jgi:two-component system, NarL family, nitrate/nitrite sensor histidine kinase NarX
MSVATSSTTLPSRRTVHPTVAHTVDALMLQERTRWAIRIHDGLTQSVTSAVLELQTLQHRIETDPEAALATLKEIELSIRDDLKQIREILFELYEGTPHREPPIAAFVGDLVQRWHLPARVSIEGNVDGISDDELEIANAVVAEALANAAKHSGTAEAVVRVHAGEGEFRIEIEDHGRGLTAVRDDDPHFGLRIMRTRAESVGGSLVVESTPGHGTTVLAVLPVGGRGEEG